MTHDIETALTAYAHGAFPMAASRDAAGFDWYSAPMRSLLPIENFHVSSSLKKLLARHPFTLTADRAFTDVITICGEPRVVQQETWINTDLIALMIDLHQAGFAHSIECWQDDRLVGGLYGVAIGGTFCAESMFSSVSGASKVALVYLVARLWAGGFTLLDTQFLNPHLLQFGAYEMLHDDYIAALQIALDSDADWHAPDTTAPYELMARYIESGLTK